MRWLLTLWLIVLVSPCHYSCSTSCTSSIYYECTACDANRGNNGRPIYGMCYCSENTDEDEAGVCQSDGSFN